jgi:hypothetical protein
MAAMTLLVSVGGLARATNCESPKVTLAILRGQVVFLAEAGSGPAVAMPMELSRWAAPDLKLVVRDQTDEQGRFQLPRLAPGLYVLSIGASGEFGHVMVQMDRGSRNRWLQIEAGRQDDRACSPTKAQSRTKE